jgi:hypothetical protein
MEFIKIINMLSPIYLSLIKLNTLEFIILTINLISLKSLQKMKSCEIYLLLNVLTDFKVVKLIKV